MDLIYGDSGQNEDVDEYGDEDETTIDTYRYDVAAEKLDLYNNSSVKRKLKSKFVTGQSSDQIVQNLLNMSDSEGE